MRREVIPLTEEVGKWRLAPRTPSPDITRMACGSLGILARLSEDTGGAFSVDDETDMVLIGYLAFLDPPKETTARALEMLRDYGGTEGADRG